MYRKRTVAILIFDDVEVLDFCGPFEVFSVANKFTDAPAFNVLTVAETAATVLTSGGLTALLHHIDVPLLFQSFYSLKSEAAPGSDGVTWQQYEADLDHRIEDLHRRIHSGRYRATPVKRAYIPKADGTMRPLGIKALRRRSQKHRLVWEAFGPRANRLIPHPCVLHPYPSKRFYANHPR